MKRLALPFEAIRRRISEKLGVCPFCMRASALGSLAAWGAYVLAGAVKTRVALPALAHVAMLVAACAFTLLISAHLVAYMVRVGRGVRAYEKSRESLPSPGGRVLSRRDFISTVLSAGAFAATIAVTGRQPAFGQADTCTGKQDPNIEDAIGIGDDNTSAEADYDAFVDSVCDATCFTKSCAGGNGCVRNTVVPRVRSEPKCGPGVGGAVVCRGKVKQCNCVCSPCDGDHTLSRWGGADYGHGFGLNGPQAEADMRADARAKCDKLCAKFKNCSAPKNCKRSGEPDFDTIKTWDYHDGVWGSEARIKKCHCGCA